MRRERRTVAGTICMQDACKLNWQLVICGAEEGCPHLGTDLDSEPGVMCEGLHSVYAKPLSERMRSERRQVRLSIGFPVTNEQAWGSITRKQPLRQISTNIGPWSGEP